MKPAHLDASALAPFGWCLSLVLTAALAAASVRSGAAAALAGDPVRVRAPLGEVRAVASPSDPLAVERAVAELWPELERQPFSSARWERRAAEVASGLDRDHRFALAGIVRDPRATTLQRVAAAELVRRLALALGGPGVAGRGLRASLHGLAEEDLAFLRGTAHGGLPGAGPACAARRALVDLGDWSDRLTLVRELEREPDPGVRRELAWSLRALRSHELLGDLAALLGPPADGWRPRAADRFPESDRAELAAAVLGTVLDATPAPEPALRAALLERALAAVDAPFCPPALEERLVAVLGGLGGPEARGPLERLTREGHAGAARALTRTQEGRARLARITRDPGASEPGRLAAATALALAPEAGDDRAAGLECLDQVASRGLGDEQRFLALLALERAR